MARSRAHPVNVLLLAASVIIGAAAYAGLIADHMVLLPLIAHFMAAALYGGAWAVQRYPSLFNVPNQAAYDALSEGDQRKVIACTLPFFYWSVTIWTGFFVAVFGVEETVAIIGAAVIAHVAEGALAMWFFLVQTSRKVRKLHEMSREEAD